ncbi:unnamed protein product [Ixodes pacificus]
MVHSASPALHTPKICPRMSILPRRGSIGSLARIFPRGVSSP